MTRDEMRDASSDCADDLSGIIEEIRWWRDGSKYDEDYKVEREPKFNPEFFAELKALTSAVAKRCAQEDSPFQ